MNILIKIPCSRNASLENIPFPADIRDQLQKMYDVIGCSCIEIVRLPDDNCLIVDDEGAINGSPYNAMASALYGGAIFGTALLGKIEHTDDGDLVTGVDVPEVLPDAQ